MSAIVPRRTSGRALRRRLHRAAACGLCRRPLGGDRGLFRDYRPPPAAEWLVAHPGCVADYDVAAAASAARELAAMIRVADRVGERVAAARLARQTGLWIPS